MDLRKPVGFPLYAPLLFAGAILLPFTAWATVPIALGLLELVRTRAFEWGKDAAVKGAGDSIVVNDTVYYSFDRVEEIVEARVGIEKKRAQIAQAAKEFGNAARGAAKGMVSYEDRLDNSTVGELREELVGQLQKAKTVAGKISRCCSEKGTSLSHAIVAQRIDSLLTNDEDHNDE